MAVKKIVFAPYDLINWMRIKRYVKKFTRLQAVFSGTVTITSSVYDRKTSSVSMKFLTPLKPWVLDAYCHG